MVRSSRQPTRRPGRFNQSGATFFPSQGWPLPPRTAASSTRLDGPEFPPPGAIDLAGQIDVASTVTGVLATLLAGTIAASSTVTGQLAIDLKGTIAAASTVTGKLAIDLKATSAAVSTATGTMNPLRGIAATSSASSDMTGDVIVTFGLAGQADAVSTMTGTVLVGMSAVDPVVSTMTGELAVAYVLAGTVNALGALGYPVLPATDLYPSSSTLPGIGPGRLKLTWSLQGTSVATSSLEAGETPLQGTIAAVSAMGRKLLPRLALYPSSSLYPGLLGAELAVTALGEDSVTITLVATVDVLITLSTPADVVLAGVTVADVLTTVGAADE